MERVVGILGQRQCRRVPEPFDKGHEELHGRERIAHSLQEKHRDAHLGKVLRTVVRRFPAGV